LGNARWAGWVEVIKRVIFVWKKGDFLDFAKVGPVEWRLKIARTGFQSQFAPVYGPINDRAKR